MTQESEQLSEQELRELEEKDAVIGRAFRISLLVILLIMLACGIGYFLSRAEPEAEIKVTESELPDVRDTVAKTELPEIPFTDITEAAGIDFIHENGAEGEKLLPETMGGGLAFFDADGDGDQDLLLVNSNNWPWSPEVDKDIMGFYLNDGQGQFTEAARAWGLDFEMYGMGVACGDYDNNGTVDLFLSGVDYDRLLKNTGDGFVDVTEQAGVAGEKEAWGTSCGWFDYDNDGRLDLFVCNYLDWSREYDLNQNFQLTGDERAYGRPQFFPGSFSYLYHNEGDGTFRDVSEEAGIQVTNPTSDQPQGKSLGVTFDDFDADGYLDIFVANDTVHNYLFHNQQDGTFADISVIAGVAYDMNGNARGAMGIDSARFRNNEEIGIAIGNFANEMAALYCSRELQLNFNDEAISNGFGPQTRLDLTFGVFYFDADLDGRLDLLTANGHLEEDINRVQSSQFYEQPPRLFWNAGPASTSEFIPLPEEKVTGDFTNRLVGRGATYADIDQDGDLDVLMTTSGRRPRLLRNDLPNDHHWIRFRLEGTQSNRDAIGALVTVKTADGVQSRRVNPTKSYISQTELPVTFGLGELTTVKEVQITWPSGQTETHQNLPADQLHNFKEPVTSQ